MTKVQKKFPAIIQKFGGAIVLSFVLMYAAIGLNGVLLFVSGMLFIVFMIALVIFLYIVNENERARAQREALEKQRAKELEEFVVIEDLSRSPKRQGR